MQISLKNQLRFLLIKIQHLLKKILWVDFLIQFPIDGSKRLRKQVHFKKIYFKILAGVKWSKISQKKLKFVKKLAKFSFIGHFRYPYIF